MLMQLTEREQEVEKCLVNRMPANEAPDTLGIPALAKKISDKSPTRLLSSWEEDNNNFFDFGWAYHLRVPL